MGIMYDGTVQIEKMIQLEFGQKRTLLNWFPFAQKTSCTAPREVQFE